MKLVADYTKHTTIGELHKLPNYIVHTLWYMWYGQLMYDKKHPKEAEGRAMGEALSQLG